MNIELFGIILRIDFCKPVRQNAYVRNGRLRCQARFQMAEQEKETAIRSHFRTVERSWYPEIRSPPCEPLGHDADERCRLLGLVNIFDVSVGNGANALPPDHIDLHDI